MKKIYLFRCRDCFHVMNGEEVKKNTCASCGGTRLRPKNPTTEGGLKQIKKGAVKKI